MLGLPRQLSVDELAELFSGRTRFIELLGSSQTDEDGRIRELGSGDPGTYRIVFHPPSQFFRRVEFEVELGEGHHHVPLLYSSFGCASYRGS